MGSAEWFSNLLAGAQGLMSGTGMTGPEASRTAFPKLTWDTPYFVFTVREPFPSQTTTTELVFGKVNEATPLVIESHMPERGVIFSDGFESDFLEFNSGTKAEIQVADRQGMLVA